MLKFARDDPLNTPNRALAAAIPAGQPVELSWRRGLDGGMAVLVDGREVMRVIDRGVGGAFDGVRIANEGGDYTLSRITVYATPS